MSVPYSQIYKRLPCFRIWLATNQVAPRSSNMSAFLLLAANPERFWPSMPIPRTCRTPKHPEKNVQDDTESTMQSSSPKV